MTELTDESKRLVDEVVDGIMSNTVMTDRHLGSSEIHLIPLMFPPSGRKAAAARTGGEVAMLYGQIDDVVGSVAGHPVFGRYFALNKAEKEYLVAESAKRKGLLPKDKPSASKPSRRPAEKSLDKTARKLTVYGVLGPMQLACVALSLGFILALVVRLLAR